MGRSVNYETANRRWAGLGPYYAMFPTAFADRVVRHHTEPGDSVLDPFAGRGTSLFSAATQNRVAIGIELNPVGFVYAKTKLTPGEQGAVTSRVLQIGRAAAANRYAESARTLPPFFHHCFAPTVRRFLVAARDQLDWRRSTVDTASRSTMLSR